MKNVDNIAGKEKQKGEASQLVLSHILSLSWILHLAILQFSTISLIYHVALLSACK